MFAYPQFFLLLLLVPLIVFWYVKKQRRSQIQFSTLSLLKEVDKTSIKKFRHMPFILRCLAVVLMVVALARPQSVSKTSEVLTEGIDIMLALDISSSMLAEDFQPKNRIQAAKEVAAEFIDGRMSDRIGLVAFSGMSFTQCPLTLDYGLLKELLSEIGVGMIEDGTAIGMAIANGVNRLRDLKAKSKVMILLTDGQNNRGELDPVTAAQTAAALGIKVYTIGVGSRGQAPYPVDTPFGKRYQMVPVDVDEDMLKEVARLTDGRYFRATNEDKLREIYGEIDELEKTKIKVKEYRRYEELFYGYLWLALAFLTTGVVLGNTRFRKIP